MQEINPPGGLRTAIAEAVRVELARQRVSQRVIAERLGKSQSYIGRRVIGEFPFTTDELEKIAAALDVPLSTLFPAERAA